MVPQRQIMANQRRPMIPVQARGRAVPVQMRPRMPVMRPQQRGMVRGQQPMAIRRPMRTRVRGQRMPVNQQFASNMNPKNNYNGASSYENSDIIIPTLNPGYQSAPDFDIIADDEIQHYDNGDDNIMSSNRSVDRSSEEEANLARLPQYIQIQKVVEHEVLDIE